MSSLIESLREEYVVILGINPEPWAVGTTFVRRHGENVRSGMAPNEKLQIYKKALAVEFGSRDGSFFGGDEQLEIEFLFWRKVESASLPGGKEKIIGNYADSTNLQKSTEDALQGRLYPNDRQIKRITSTIMEQGPDVEPAILIKYRIFWMDPLIVKNLNLLIKQTHEERMQEYANDNDW